MPFQDLNLPVELLEAIEKLGYESPTPIQSAAIPLISAGRDLKASANTGTGKTAAFLLPALAKVIPPPKAGTKGPRVVILVPTRELAMQVTNESVKLSRFLPKVKTVCVYGGVPFPKQKQQLSKKVDILIATPGRFIDHLRRGKLDLSSVEMFILDEADRMLDMGFFEPVQEIYSAFQTPPQTLMFSATLKGPVLKLSKKLLNNPEEVSVTGKMISHDDIEQFIHFADDLSHKKRLIDHLLSDESVHQAIIFTSTKRFAEELVGILKDKGHHVAPLHGDMCQHQRTRTMKRMRDGKVKILVATDVAARGLDVHTISHVFNFDLPTNAEDYVHRIGRTGRAGAKGTAISLVSLKDRQVHREIEKFTGQKIEVLIIPGMEPKMKSAPPRSSGKDNRRKHIKPSYGKRNSDSRPSRKADSKPNRNEPWKKGPPKRKGPFKKKPIAA
jgi:superfamily II DNA/RNA helicase